MPETTKKAKQVAQEATSAPPQRAAVYDCRPQATLTPPPYRAAPWYIVLQDLLLILSQALYIPLVLVPLNLPEGGIFQDLTLLGLVYQIFAVGVTLVILPFVFGSFYFGLPWPVATLIGVISWIWLAYKMQGDVTIIPVDPAKEKDFPRETWLFVNGICTTVSGHKKILARLKELFGRDCIGVNNKSLGFISDLLECLVQRDLRWLTTDIRDGYEVLKDAINDSSKKRIVLIAHSQGGIICSQWIDQLLADFDRAALNRLEIYTFASAANHFSSPLDAEGNSPFAHVEHFAHQQDFVARIGVLAFTSPQQAELPVSGKLKAGTGAGPARGAEDSSTPLKVRSKFAGTLFVTPGPGHLLISHYLGAQNILDTPEAQRFSQLVKYRNGGQPA